VTSGGSGLSGVTVKLMGAATRTTTTAGNGNYSFLGLSNGVYTVIPTMTGYAFTPQSRSFNISGADVTGQSFSAPLGKPDLVSPSGFVDFNPPSYTWNAVPNATWYLLCVDDSTGNKINKWYSAEQAGCSNGTGTCTASPTIALVAAGARWWVCAWNPNGYGPWSDGLEFTVPAPTLPAKVTLISPSGTIDTSTPTYTWAPTPNAPATWYLLYVDDSTGNRINVWYSASQAGCPEGAGNCTVSPGTVLAPGSAKWWVQTYGAGGNGPWSDGMAFSVSP